MKLHWFLNEKSLFESEGEIPLVNQTVYFHDFSSVPISRKKRYKVVRVDRTVTLSVKDMRTLTLVAKDGNERYYEAIAVIEKESEGGKVTGVALPFFKVALDIAQIYLVTDSVTIEPAST